MVAGLREDPAEPRVDTVWAAGHVERNLALLRQADLAFVTGVAGAVMPPRGMVAFGRFDEPDADKDSFLSTAEFSAGLAAPKKSLQAASIPGCAAISSRSPASSSTGTPSSRALSSLLPASTPAIT